mgnify:CR=1 FL=1
MKAAILAEDLQTLDPIFVNFSLPQQRLAAIAVGDTVRVNSNALLRDAPSLLIACGLALRSFD